MRITTSAGGSMASMAVAMMRFHSFAESPPEIIRLMPITTVYMDSELVMSSGQRYWFQPRMKRITKSAAMLVLESGSTTSQKKRMGPAPSMRAASASSSGMVRKNWRKRKVAVADAMSGSVRPTYESRMPRSDATLKVGMIRTSIGSMRVTKIIQKKKFRPGKRKYTIAKDDRI